MATPTHVRVVRGNIAPGQLSALATAIEQRVLPELQSVHGFEGAELRVDDDGIACEYHMYFSDCPMGLEEIDELYQTLMGKALTPDMGAAVEEFRRLRIVHPREIMAG